MMGDDLFRILISKKQISVSTIKSALRKVTKINYYAKGNHEISEE